MKLPGSNIHTETTGVSTSSAFKVGDAGVILDILRTKIYKDPIMAICREITCNARDAHREVGTPERPIEIEFPSLWNAGQLRIRDFGPGISPDRMADIFVAFGKSTKRSDNVQTGGFGLGAKTPFAYTDSFTVITVVDGFKYTYAAYIDETKVGQMDLLGKPTITDDRNGTTIVIGITKNDVATFSDYMIKCTKHWDVKPIFHGLNDRYQYPDVSAQYSGTGWAFPNSNAVAKSRSYYNDSFNSYAIVDGIEYHIDPNAIKGLTDVESTLLRTGFYLYFDVGDLVLAASRDNLHYEDVTNQMIKDRLSLLKKELIDIVQNKIKNANSYLEAVKAYSTVKGVFNRANLMEHITDIKWQGHEIKETFKASDFGHWATLQTYYWDQWDKRIKKESTAIIEHLKDGTSLFVHDIKHKHVPRYLVEYLYKTKGLKRIQVVALRDVPYSRDYHEAVRRAKAKNETPPTVTYEKKWLGLLGFKSLNDELEAMPKAARKKRGNRGKLKKEDNHILGYEIEVDLNQSCGFSTVSTSFDPEEGGFYFKVDLKTGTISSDGNAISGHQIALILESAKELLDEPVVAFSQARVDQIKRHGYDKDWKPVWPALVEKVTELSKNYDWGAYKEAVKNYHYSWRWHTDTFCTVANYLDDLDANSPIVKWFKKSEEVDSVLKSDKNLRQMAKNILKKGFVEPVRSAYEIDKKMDSECRTLYKAVKSRYPLLQMLDPYAGSIEDRKNAIVHYINTVDGYTP